MQIHTLACTPLVPHLWALPQSSIPRAGDIAQDAVEISLVPICVVLGVWKDGEPLPRVAGHHQSRGVDPFALRDQHHCALEIAIIRDDVALLLPPPLSPLSVGLIVGIIVIVRRHDLQQLRRLAPGSGAKVQNAVVRFHTEHCRGNHRDRLLARYEPGSRGGHQPLVEFLQTRVLADRFPIHIQLVTVLDERNRFRWLDCLGRGGLRFRLFIVGAFLVDNFDRQRSTLK